MSRLQLLARLEHRLWPAVRNPLHDLYIQLIGEEHFKNAFADELVLLYPSLIRRMSRSAPRCSPLSSRFLSLSRSLSRLIALSLSLALPLALALSGARALSHVLARPRRVLPSPSTPRAQLTRRMPRVRAAPTRSATCTSSTSPCRSSPCHRWSRASCASVTSSASSSAPSSASSRTLSPL
eukprot:2823039-Rhodomonas_salina.1